MRMRGAHARSASTFPAVLFLRRIVSASRSRRPVRRLTPITAVQLTLSVRRFCVFLLFVFFSFCYNRSPCVRVRDNACLQTQDVCVEIQAGFEHRLMNPRIEPRKALISVFGGEGGGSCICCCFCWRSELSLFLFSTFFNCN